MTPVPAACVRMSMKLYKTTRGPVIEIDDTCYQAPVTDWDALFNQDDLANALRRWRDSPPCCTT